MTGRRTCSSTSPRSRVPATGRWMKTRRSNSTRPRARRVRRRRTSARPDAGHAAASPAGQDLWLAREPELEWCKGYLVDVRCRARPKILPDALARVYDSDGGAVPVVLRVGDELDCVRAGPEPDRDREIPELIPVKGVGEVDVERGRSVDADVGRGGHQVRVVVVGH